MISCFNPGAVVKIIPVRMKNIPTDRWIVKSSIPQTIERIVPQIGEVKAKGITKESSPFLIAI